MKIAPVRPMNGMAVTRFTTGPSMNANSQARKKTMIRSPKTTKTWPTIARTMNPSAIAPSTRMASSHLRSLGVSSIISTEAHLLADLGHRLGGDDPGSCGAGGEDLVDPRRVGHELEVALAGRRVVLDDP